MSLILKVLQFLNANRVFQYFSCFCGKGDIHRQASSTQCYDGNASRCTGNQQQICGGIKALSVYTGMTVFQKCDA